MHEGEGVAPDGPSVQTLMELRGAQCGGAFLAPGLVQQQCYIRPGVKRNVRMGKHRQKFLQHLERSPCSHSQCHRAENTGG